ncbi:MAG TPA: adenylate/guanylate cyclase domain-containing protein, partial [Actinomycetota bacterium]
MAACPTCGFDNPSGFRFCGSCAAPLGLTCPNCGADVPSGFRFCGQCAAPIGQPRAEPEREEPVAERRHVSVLFADLVGFTTLSESRDPEDVRELLSRYFDTGRAVVDRYGGVVEKFIGDAVMAVWGTPIVYEDDAERAVRAGLDLVEAVAALGREVGAPELTARVGVLTGEAAVTLGAIGQGMVAGDLVNTASRLQSAAEPGSVLVGESTCRAAARAIAFEEAGAFTPKGKSEPMRTWRAVRVIARRLGAGREAMLEAPFVGRGEELRLLKELLQATMRERKVRLVSVTGIGGIGKSRLAREFMKYLDGLKEAVFWHQGRSPAYGEGVAFWALGEMVRMRAGIAESDEPAEARFKLGACVTETIGDPEERSWVEPRLAHLLGLEEQAPGEREELFAAWRCFFERIAEHGPAVMVFEDLQWADQGLLDFIDSILEWTRAQPILLLTLARPELSQKRPDWGAARRSFTAMHLEPLPDAAMAELVEGFVRGLPPQDVAGILERAEGVPLYAVETIRMLADRGVLHAEEDGYRAVGSIGEIDVPGSLHALIAARLDALPPPDRALVQDASVLGKSFTLEGLAAIAGPVTENQLRELVRREFLVRDADPRSPERGQYAFVQSLIREVAYGTLARRDRRAKHLAAAGHFESRDEGELAAVVATHYLEAYRASPQGPDGEAVAASARDWLVRAAWRSMSLGSPLPALAYAKEALTIASDDRDRASLLDLAGEAAFRAARREESIELWT